MRRGTGLPATTSFTAATSCGPSSGLHLDRDVQLARHHGLERTFHPVDGNDQDVLPRLEPGLFDRLDRPDRHVVVVGVRAR